MLQDGENEAPKTKQNPENGGREYFRCILARY